MDSLTQIVLGSAVAEASLGKKIGNRAMVWGAIAGTIPDLDVISNGFMSPIDALAFHRGPTHSFLFEILMAVGLGWLVHKFYNWKHHKQLGIASWSVFFLLIAFLIGNGSDWSIKGLSISALTIAGFGYLIYRRYTREAYESPSATVREWQWMFFWSLFTHPILDCFTTYGTQFLLPLSSARVAFNNIAVADPLYTLPFLICLVVAIFLPKGSLRAKWNNAGLIISSIYMLFTIFNKFYINSVFKDSLDQQGIVAKNYMTSPSILNNVLWSGIAETDTAYYYGQYSLFDKEKKFVLSKKMKTESAIESKFSNDVTFNTLKWFSAGYYFMEQRTPDTLSYYDMRFGTFRIKPDDADNFVFKFDLLSPDGKLLMLKQDERGPKGMTFSDVFEALWNRIKGI
jgi:inner membrane protein